VPEGPEVRRHADRLAVILTDEPVAELWARTKAAKAWLAENQNALVGKRIQSVRSHGKNLVGRIEGGFYFYSHLMMWGRWQVFGPGEVPVEIDRRERARITAATGATAVLFSAPVFEVGAGDPYEKYETLRALGPDILPYPDEPPFEAAAFVARLQTPEHAARTIGAALLDQTILAGVGNYLRAEILFQCRLDPWRLVADLTGGDLGRLNRVIPETAVCAYAAGGATVPDTERERMKADPSLVYSNATGEWGMRHFVFRRTNLPCLVCGTPIRQKRQVTRQLDDGGEKERIIYFCPACQQTTIDLAPARGKKRRGSDGVPGEERERAPR